MSNLSKPTVYLVGAPKAGTSALSEFLAQHPQICIPRIKEPNFLCADFDLPGPKTEQEYLSLFSITPETKLLVDASILYLYSREAALAIKEYAPDSRILMILRNPVEAMYSWHSQMVFTANEPITNFKEALDAEQERKRGHLIPTAGTTKRCPDLLIYRDIMNYADQVKRYLDVFGRERVLILLHDDFKANPAKIYEEIIEFLELDSFTPEFKTVNSNKVRRSWRSHYWLKQLFAAPARAILPAVLRLRIVEQLNRINSQVTKRPPMDKKLQEILKAECLPDVIRLGELVERELSHWCK